MQDNKCIHEKLFRLYMPDTSYKDREWDKLSEKEQKKLLGNELVKNALMRCSEHCRNTVREAQ